MCRYWMISLVVCLVFSDVAIGQNLPPKQPGDETASNTQGTENLPWQPGLSQGIPPRDLNPPAAQPIPQLPIPQLPVVAATIPADGPQDTANVSPTLPPGENSVVMPAVFIQDNGPATPQATPDTGTITRVTREIDVLPNGAGQVWRTYDISPYTYTITSTNRPQQALIDWILKETGTDLWFSEPLGVMNATRDKLHVYHTPEIHARIKAIVDRFVYSRGQPHTVGLKLLTVTSPNWRTTAFPMLQPVEVQSPGVEAWLLSKENAALLANELRNRNDHQEHYSGDLSIIGGQKYALSRTRPVSFVRNLQWVNDGIGRYQPLMDRIDEGFTVELSGLGSIDGSWQETIIRCNIDQIEKMQRVSVDLPTNTGQIQSVDLHIPQMVVWRLHERFRWPTDKVLMLSCGVVAAPAPQPNGLLGITQLLNGGRDRADALMFIEHKGVAPQATPPNGQVGQMLPINGRR